MLNYIRIDSNNTKKYKTLLGVLIIVILSVILIINKYSNDEIHVISSNSRRLITNLNNYTETMSEFIVNDDVKIQEQLAKSLNDFQEKQLKKDEEHKKLIIKDIVIKRIDEKMISKSGSFYVDEDKCYTTF